MSVLGRQLKVTISGLAVVGFGCCTFANEISVPFKSSAWTVLSYKKIPANKVDFSNENLNIQVQKSAGPVVYKLDAPKKIKGFFVEGNFSGQKNTETKDFDDDSILRVGLVATGKKVLSGIKRFFVADWVKKLFALAPEGTGLDKIYFYNITNRKNLLGKTRVHPKSELIVETESEFVDKDGTYKMRVDLPSAREVAAIWISVDGDDTGSEYKTSISNLQLKVEE